MTLRSDPEHDLIRRRDAAQATKAQWERRAWRMGSADCVRMFASHVRRLGYKVKLPPEGSYRTVRAALTKLAQLGHADLPAAIDAVGLTRITPARAIVGDVVELPSEGEDRLPALGIVLGNGTVLAWHDDAPGGAAVLRPSMFVTAWDVIPR